MPLRHPRRRPKKRDDVGDVQNNALVITAPPKIMRQIMDILDKLDIRRREVLVEAIIVEVDQDKTADFGVNWAEFEKGNGTNRLPRSPPRCPALPLSIWPTRRGNRSERLFNLAVNAPKTTFIFAHLGGTNFRFWNTLALARTAAGFFADNIYFDISATVVLVAGSPVEPEFVWTLRNVGTDHVLLGSDYPQFTLGKTVAALNSLNLTAQEKGLILSGNARKLFGK